MAKKKKGTDMPEMPPEVRAFFVEKGREGGIKGGSLAWKNYSKEEKTARAKKNALARKKKGKKTKKSGKHTR